MNAPQLGLRRFDGVKPSRQALIFPHLVRKVLHRVQGGLCAICGLPIPVDKGYRPFRSVSIDHVIPRSRRGLDALGNLVAVHKACNYAKADRMPTGCELIWLLAVNAQLGVQPQRW